MLASIRRFFEKRGKDGQAIIEYAIILVLVAIAVIVVLRGIGGRVNNSFTTVNNALQASGGGDDEHEHH
jgi:pilus assembly protein Flp/PilA